MSLAQVAAPTDRARALSERAATWVHYGTLLLGAAALLYLARDQWFFFDEWDIIWPAEGARRFVEGHNGHWSAVPIAVWAAIQNTLGLASYLPFVSVAIAAHLVVAHLIWRILRRIDISPWIGTALVAVFVFLGAAGENLLWAFQMGFMGAMAFALGALLIAMRPTLGPIGLIGVIVLLTLGAATAGTALPFFLAVGAVVLYRHGWRAALLAVGVPSAIYLVWYVGFAGDNPTAIYRAQGIGQMLRGIPEFVSVMFVGSFDAATPVPGFGIIIVTAIAIWAIVAVAGRRLSLPIVVSLSLLASGLLFAALTAYSRLGLGVGAADESRYIYVVIATSLPVIALMLTRVARGSRARLITVLALIAVVLVFNAGALVVRAGGDSARELGTQNIASAALDLADQFPGQVDEESRPDPVYLPRTLGQMRTLESEFGLSRSTYGDDARLTALLTVGLTTADAAGAACTTALQPGSVITVGPDGTVLEAPDGATLTVFAQDGASRGLSQSLTLSPGSTRVSVLQPIDLVVEALTAPTSACEGTTP